MKTTTFGLLLLGVAVLHSSVASATKITSCPSKSGYDAIADKNWVGGSSTSGAQLTFAAAEAKCRATSGCTAFNNYGYYIIGTPSSYVDLPGMCVYVKQVCPPSAGYKSLGHVNWNTNSATSGGQLSSGALAAAKCNATSTCVAWNSLGYYLLNPSNAAISYYAYNDATMCTYAKDACPPKSGYTAKPDTNWVGSTNIDLSTGGQLSPADAEDRCNRDARCTAWNTFGH